MPQTWFPHFNTDHMAERPSSEHEESLFRRSLVELSEKVRLSLGKLENIRKMEPCWGEGIFLGISWRSGEAFIGTKES